MIEQQVRPWSVLDDKVLGVMNDIPRENFVPEHFRALAYSETRIPLSCCQEMIPPAVAGRILQALEIKPRHRILENRHRQWLHQRLPESAGQQGNLNRVSRAGI